jgi:23S rRNA pseudouridine2604 synthase/16S rRNA pseudouridine516 synthase
MGTKVEDGDQVEVEGQKIEKSTKHEKIYLVFNKPAGIVCTTDRRVESDNIIDFIKYPTRIFPIGRLDKPSEGLIFLTNDGDIVNKILRARNNHEKEYIVSVNRPINRDFIQSMSNGVEILDTITKNCFVKQLGPKKFRIILTQGLNRQIRRMCESLGFRVKSLKRVRIMNIKLDVSTGEYREFTKEELFELNELLKNSSKTYD